MVERVCITEDRKYEVGTQNPWRYIISTPRPLYDDEQLLVANVTQHILDGQDIPPTERWVSVEDRLPEKSAWYLVSLVNTRTGHRWKVSVPADYSHGKWDYAYLGGEDPTWTLNNTVTHWMPLPEPPKGVNGDETD